MSMGPEGAAPTWLVARTPGGNLGEEDEQLVEASAVRFNDRLLTAVEGLGWSAASIRANAVVCEADQ
jgi:hypothetical protein